MNCKELVEIITESEYNQEIPKEVAKKKIVALSWTLSYIGLWKKKDRHIV